MLTDFIAQKMKELQNLYRDIFGNEQNQKYFQKHINISFGAWEKDLKKIIGTNCSHKLGETIVESEKIIVVVQYLMQQNRVKLYKSFIHVWKKYDSATATEFEKKIMLQIAEQDLLSIEKEFQLDEI